MKSVHSFIGVILVTAVAAAAPTAAAASSQSGPHDDIALALPKK